VSFTFLKKTFSGKSENPGFRIDFFPIFHETRYSDRGQYENYVGMSSVKSALNQRVVLVEAKSKTILYPRMKQRLPRAKKLRPERSAVNPFQPCRNLIAIDDSLHYPCGSDLVVLLPKQ